MRRGCAIACLLAACGRFGFDDVAGSDGGPGDGSGDAVAPGVEMHAYIKAPNSETFDQFGFAIALSADGNTLAVSTPFEDGPGNAASQCGAVYVFVRTGDTWTHQALLHPNTLGTGDLFGVSVALSADGNTLAAGAINEDSVSTTINGDEADNSTTDAGAAYVFVRVGTAWSQQAYIKGNNTEGGDHFGGFLALSANGNRLAIAADLEDSADIGIDAPGVSNAATDSGAVYTFLRSGSTWIAESYIKASNTDSGDDFGYGLSLSADGSLLVVGAPAEDSGAITINGNQADDSVTSAGAVYVFVDNGLGWVQEAYLKPPAIDFGDFFGRTLVLSGDRSTLAVASPGEDSIAPNSGAVFTFTRDPQGMWASLQTLKAFNPGDNDQFGLALAIRDNGRDVFIGAPDEDSDAVGLGGFQGNDNRSNSGAVYAYSRVPVGVGWMTGFYNKSREPTMGDEFGSAITMSSDARTYAIGVHSEDSNANTINGNATDDSSMDSGSVEITYFGQ